MPETASTPEAASADVAIEGGRLVTGLDRVYALDGHVRLRIRSDQFVVVDVDDRDLSWSIPAGGEALIEFATRSKKGFDLELHRHKGVLVLHLED